MILGCKWMSYLGVQLDMWNQKVVWPKNLPAIFCFVKEIGITIKNLLQIVQNPAYQEDAI